MKTHKDLLVWQKSIDLVTEIYKITKGFPKEEIYGITSQIRRSSVSVPSNIAEGAGRKSDKEFKQFLFIALGSLSELETQIIIAKNLEYINQDINDKIIIDIIALIKMISSFIKTIK
jgi:four helix bundle protein